MRFSVRSSLCLGMLGCLVLVGCGASKTLVKGQVVKGGKPFTVSDQGMFILSFVPESESKDQTVYAVDTKSDGSFVIVGTDRKGIPPGKYRVVVQALDPYKKQVDKLQGKFAPGKTALVVDVTGKEDLKIEVGP